MIERGEIYWADLAEPRGSAPGYRRPVVVIQADPFNASRLTTTICVALTSNLDRARVPANVVVPRVASGLGSDSVALVTSIVTVDEADLDGPVGKLPFDLISDIDRGLRTVLDL